jgi:2-phospho-L-lactate guanylyltransferase
MMTTVVIPIKQLVDAKQRLAPMLNPDERQQLFTAMVEDVLTAVEACVQIDSIVVVTDDEAVATLARSYGAQVRPEPDNPGLIEAVTQTGQQLQEEGVDCMVFLPGDVPLVSAEELDVVLEGFGISGEPEFMIVPANDLGGSNCVVCAPPGCMEFAFGLDSFRKHLAIAKERGIEPQIAKLPGIGLDIDTPDDMAELVRQVRRDAREGQEYSTVRVLTALGILKRLTNEVAETG